MTHSGLDKFKIRLSVVKALMFLIWLVFIGRLVILQLVQSDRYLAAARQQQYHMIELQAKRGTIYDCEGRILAQDIDSYSFYVVPGEIKNKRAAARSLARITGTGSWSAKFAGHSRFLWVARKTSAALERRLRNSKIETLNHIIEPRRVYPAGDLGLAVLGRVDIDNRGLSGIELYYDELLSGTSGQAMLKRDGLGNSYLFDEELLTEP